MSPAEAILNEVRAAGKAFQAPAGWQFHRVEISGWYDERGERWTATAHFKFGAGRTFRRVAREARSAQAAADRLMQALREPFTGWSRG